MGDDLCIWNTKAVTTIPFRAFIQTDISDTYINFTCPPITYLSANELLIKNRVTLTMGRYNTTFKCIKNYYPVSGDLVRKCERGRWTGVNPMCEVLPHMHKGFLATAIGLLASLITIPYLCCDFFWKLDDRRDLHFYRYFRSHYSSRRHYPRDVRPNYHRPSVFPAIHTHPHFMQDGFLHATKNTRNFIFKMAPDGSPTLSAHPARFSPEDKFSRHRVILKRRFGILPADKP